ncbi:MAG: hypothetical protein EA383_15585 [Spirochaetaceae bacterium]|nr:MAG: hypothetical protein EA383_15525 [Spirochaetaceae bacterium]TVQ22381.1 MAG: hypothetical protein EA383_15585 [Spirochaetaceae bacterium]
MTRLHLPLTVCETPCVVVVSEIAAVQTSLLGETVGSAATIRSELIAAVDLLVTGF